MEPERGARAAAVPRAATLALVAAVVLAGCASVRPDASAAAAVAEAFHTAVSAGDGAAACELLVPAAVEELESDASARCADAVLTADLPSASGVEQADAFGRQAQVVLSGDVVFLTVSGGDWLVTAAGCTPRAERPYDCRVSRG